LFHAFDAILLYGAVSLMRLTAKRFFWWAVNALKQAFFGVGWFCKLIKFRNSFVLGFLYRIIDTICFCGITDPKKFICVVSIRIGSGVGQNVGGSNECQLI